MLAVMAELLPVSKIQAAEKDNGSKSYNLYGSTTASDGSFDRDALATLISAVNGGQIKGNKTSISSDSLTAYDFDLDRDGSSDVRAYQTLVRRLSTCSIKGKCKIKLGSSGLAWFQANAYYGSTHANYYSTLTFDFGVDLSKESLSVSAKTYTGSPITAVETVTASPHTYNNLGSGVTVTYTARMLTRGIDYITNYTDNTNAGTASVSITGQDVNSYHYFGTQKKAFTINPAQISSTTITVPDVTWPATSSVATAVFNGKTLTSGTDYVATHVVSSGNHSIKLTGKGNFTGTANVGYNIQPADLSTAIITVSSQTYTGKAIEPDFSVKLAGGKILTAGTDFTAEFKNNINAGTATITITGINNCKGSVSENFAILRKSITGADIQFTDVTYNGSKQTPVPVVTLDGVPLQKVTEFQVDYGDGCVAVGNYTVKVIGTGNYKSSAAGSFAILPLSINAAEVKVPEMYYTGKAITPAPVVEISGLTLKSGTDYTADYYNNIHVGTGIVVINGTGNCKGSVSGTFTISAGSLGGALVTAADQKYTGKELKPEPVVQLGGAVLKAGTDYTVSYSNNIEVGTATVTVTGIGNYQDTAKGTFAITKVAPPAETPTSPVTSASAETPTSPGTSASAETPASPESSSAIHASDDITPENPAVLKEEESKIFAVTDDTKDIKGSTYALLMAKGVSKTAKSITITWKKIPGATKYIIYGNRCGKGKKYKKLDEVKKSKSSWTKKKLKKGTYYKVMVVAVKGKKVLATSKTIHVATLGGKKGNPASVSLTRKKKAVKTLTLKQGNSKTITATVKNGHLPVNTHRKVAWESSDLGVAKVNSKGKITGVGPGTCTIYAYAQNGVYASIAVTVK